MRQIRFADENSYGVFMSFILMSSFFKNTQTRASGVYTNLTAAHNNNHSCIITHQIASAFCFQATVKIRAQSPLCLQLVIRDAHPHFPQAPLIDTAPFRAKSVPTGDLENLSLASLITNTQHHYSCQKNM